MKWVSHAFTTLNLSGRLLNKWCLPSFLLCCLLYGQYFLVDTCHRNLAFFHAKTSVRVIRWYLVLQRFSRLIFSFFKEKRDYRCTGSCSCERAEWIEWDLFNTIFDVAGHSACSRGDQRGITGSLFNQRSDLTYKNVLFFHSIDVRNSASQERPSDLIGGTTFPKSSTCKWRWWFDSVQNETQRHLGLHGTLRVLHDNQRL